MLSFKMSIVPLQTQINSPERLRKLYITMNVSLAETVVASLLCTNTYRKMAALVQAASLTRSGYFYHNARFWCQLDRARKLVEFSPTIEAKLPVPLQIRRCVKQAHQSPLA